MHFRVQEADINYPGYAKHDLLKTALKLNLQYKNLYRHLALFIREKRFAYSLLANRCKHDNVNTTGNHFRLLNELLVQNLQEQISQGTMSSVSAVI